MPPSFPLTLACYAAACTFFFLSLVQPIVGWTRRLGLLLLLCGLVGQGVDIAWLCLHGLHPGTSAREALYFVSFLMLLAVPLRTYRQPSPLFGALILPVAMVIDVLARALPGPMALAVQLPGRASRLLFLHIGSATLGIALFGVAAATSTAYMLSERRLKQQRLPHGIALSGPSLETLDGWSQQSVVCGLLAFTAALVSGTYWMLHALLARGTMAAPEVGLLARYLLSQPRYLLAVITWLLFAGILFGRTALGLRGRWTAQMTLVGFWTSLGVLMIYLLHERMGGAS